LIASASFDNKIQLIDFRNSSKPVLHSLTGFCGASVTRHGSIFHPLFVQNGDVLVANGESSEFLCLFDTKSGQMISRGRLGFQTSAMAEMNGNSNCFSPNRAIALAHSKFCSFYEPFFEEIKK